MTSSTGRELDADDVMAMWPLTDAIVSDRTSSYRTRAVLTIVAREGQFVVKVDREQLAEDLERRLMVLDHVWELGFEHAPALVRTRADTRAAQLGAGAAFVLEHIPDTLVPHQRTLGSSWAEVGRVAARLNRMPAGAVPFAVDIGDAIEGVGRRAAEVPFGAELGSVLRRIEPLADLTSDALVHGEINESNAARRGDGTVVLLDWDQAGGAPAALEYGYPLIVRFLDEARLDFDRDTAEAFYGGYIDAGGVIDRDALFVAALFHALRYMWFGDVHGRWARIQHALSHEDDLCSVVP